MRHILPPVLLALGLAACNNRTTEVQDTRAPEQGSPNEARAEDPLVIGTVTVIEEVPEGTLQGTPPRSTSIDYMVDPTLAEACGMSKKPTAYFELDSAKVTDTAEAKIEDVAKCLQEQPLRDDAIQIVGHADERGPQDYNQALGLDRANSVAQALVAQGIDRSRIQTASRGEAMADEPDYWDDRRVVIRLAQ